MTPTTVADMFVEQSMICQYVERGLQAISDRRQTIRAAKKLRIYKMLSKGHSMLDLL
jgi:hypothetical protein